MPVHIEIVSDIVCPWCFVGKRRLEAALAERADAGIDVSWLPFELAPDLPTEGVPRGEYLRARFADPAHFADAQQRLAAIGAELGIAFRFDDKQRMPNTRRLHALLATAGIGEPAVARSRQAALQQRLMSGYFERGEDLSDRGIVIAAAVETGMSAADASAAWANTQLHAQVAGVERELQGMGVTSVPTFIFDRRWAIAGAHEVEVLVQAIDRARSAVPE